MDNVDTFKRTDWRSISDTERARVRYGMHYISGNRQPYFSITYESQEAMHGRWREGGGGAGMDYIRVHFPELAPLTHWHLCDQNGEGMHYTPNAIFWYGMRVGWRMRGEFDRDPWGCFLDTIKWGVLPEDKEEPKLTLTHRELCEFIEERAPKLREAFLAAMKAANVEFIKID